MSNFRRYLPQGRGTYQGENAYIAQNDSYVQRSALLPAYGQAIFGPHPLAMTGSVAGANVPIHNLRMVVCQPVFDVLLLNSASTSVNAAGVGQTVEVALFSLENSAPTSSMNFVQVPGSFGIFDCSTTGRKTITYRQPIQLTPGVQYFYGLLAKGFTSQLTSVPAPAVNRPVRMILTQNSATTTSMPQSISTLDTNWSTSLTAAIPVVQFLTPDVSFLL